MKFANFHVSAFSLILLAAAACSGDMTGGKELQAANTGKEVVNVNGTSIREGYLNMLGEINPKIKAQLNNPAARKQLLQNVVEQELLFQESLKRGLDKKKEVAQKTQLYQKIIVSQALLDDELTQRAKKYYDEKKDEEFTKVKIAHIQVNFAPESDKPADKKAPAKDEPTQSQKDAALAKIKLIQTKLKSGEDFGKLAEELSDDKTTRKKGGDFGSVSRNDKRLARRGLEKLAVAAFALKQGEVSDPIETKTGYHLIKVLSEAEQTAFEDAEKLLRFQMQKEVKDDLVNTLTKASNVTYADGTTPATATEVKTEIVPTPDNTAPAPDATTPPPSTQQQQQQPAGDGAGKTEPAKDDPKKNEFKPVLKTGTDDPHHNGDHNHEGHNH